MCEDVPMAEGPAGRVIAIVDGGEAADLVRARVRVRVRIRLGVGVAADQRDILALETALE